MNYTTFVIVGLKSLFFNVLKEPLSEGGLKGDVVAFVAKLKEIFHLLNMVANKSNTSRQFLH